MQKLYKNYINNKKFNFSRQRIHQNHPDGQGVEKDRLGKDESSSCMVSIHKNLNIMIFRS